MDGSTSSEALALEAAQISALAISDERARLLGELTTLRQDVAALTNTLQQIAEYADEGAQGEALQAGFALGRIVELCASVSDVEADDDDEEE